MMYQFRMTATLVTLVVLLSVSNVSDAQIGPTEQAVSQKTIDAAVNKIEYKTIGDVTLNLHVFYPPNHKATDKRPAIVFFFGGGWVGGSPKQFDKQAWYLSQRGMVTACAEYRIKSWHKTSPRECVKDGKSAIRFLRSNAAKFGIDPERIAAGGGSAGGHVAAATATVTKINEDDDDVRVNAVPCALVLFNPVLDNGPGGWGHERVKDYWKDISPMHNLSAPVVPSLFMLGSEDKLLPVATAKEFKSRVEKLGGRCDVEVAKGQGHGYFNRGESFLETLELADNFLVSVGLLEGKGSVRETLGELIKNETKLKKAVACEERQVCQAGWARENSSADQRQTRTSQTEVSQSPPFEMFLLDSMAFPVRRALPGLASISHVIFWAKAAT